MTISDPTVQGWTTFCLAAFGITVMICLSVVLGKAAAAKALVAQALADAERHKANAADSEARKAEWAYKTAITERIGAVQTVALAIPQKEIDDLALEQIKQRIASIRVEVKAAV